MSAVQTYTDRVSLSNFIPVSTQPEKTEKPKINMIDALAEFIFTTKYAKYSKENKRRETWHETVNRVEDMHLRKFSHLDESIKNEIRWAFDMARSKRVVPSMRSMQFGGAAVEAHNARIYNCAVRHLDCVTAFAELFYLLLCGCGTGVGLTHKYINRIPKVVKKKSGHVIYFIADTIEGWAEAAKVLILSYTEGNIYSGKNIQFNYSLIRPAGAELKTGGGKAPGPDGLRMALYEINSLFKRLLKLKITRMRPIHAYDILMHLADAVLSGGVRRSATSVVFDLWDEEMMNAKTGKWGTQNPQRARSNNSVLLIRDSVTWEQFTEIMKRTIQWGEPGFVFAETEDVLYNPCFEVSFVPVTDEGKTGVQFCNLTSINGAKVKSERDFYEASRAATIIGTLQATYTDFPYLSNVAKELTEAESLLGVSITAMMENPDILLVPEYQKTASKLCVETNRKWAEILGVKQAARVTVVKPEGTSTLALGSMASGIHPAHARQMFRRVQMNKLDPVYKHFAMYNSQLCEEGVWSKNKTDDVVTFPITVPDSAIVKGDLTALSHLEIIRDTQVNWVLPGTTEVNTRPVSHNVSCTVIVQPNEWGEVADFIFSNRYFFTAVSLIPASGDKAYKQAPMEAVSTEEDMIRFEKMVKSYLPVDYSLMIEETDETNLMQESSCSGGKCELV